MAKNPAENEYMDRNHMSSNRTAPGLALANSSAASGSNDVTGDFVDLDGERYYAIRNVDKMAPFFISVVSSTDHWLFVSSTGGLTAGRVSPETSLFPYVTVDKVHDSAVHTGSKTLLRVKLKSETYEWEPFNVEHDGLYDIDRNIYKNTSGNKICFEECNHDLQMLFRYRWMTSDEYGFIRYCELENAGDGTVSIDLVDGLQNILPAGAPRTLQTTSSNLVDAYKWNELDEKTGLAFFTLYSGITDRPEPCESLKANTVFCLGLEEKKILISSEQLEDFRQGRPLRQEVHKRGVRGAYLVNLSIELSGHSSRQWQFVANLEQAQSQAVELRRALGSPVAVSDAVAASVDIGVDELSRIMAGCDGFQSTAQESVSVHHYANVLFNVLRGGVFFSQYDIPRADFITTVRHFNAGVFQRNKSFLESLPEKVSLGMLQSVVKEQGDAQLQRLANEYMPITFGRRHGDPSRPWNQFSIRLRDRFGNRLLSYEGNWRDIFQNWEASLMSFPEFTESVIAKFVNASTLDGYNPYRIMKEGIDWEVEDPDDPWSFIGYWGDHQIIYLLKLLELSNNFHPARLNALLYEPVFAYANVPYRIKPFSDIVDDPKKTIDYDEELAEKIEQRVAKTGADGKLVLDRNGEVCQVTLLEKLLVPLLSKLGNLVIDGGIWLNTQRPEWNDANNALVGQGLSMVTLYYARRYIDFMQNLLSHETGTFPLSPEVAAWLQETASAIKHARSFIDNSGVDVSQRHRSLMELGEAASRYRETVYKQGTLSAPVQQPVDTVRTLLKDALAVIDSSIESNLREDGLYNAYNLIDMQNDSVTISALYPMLEGQVAALSSGCIAPDRAVSVLESLFDSPIYRSDQHSFMLYPDRSLPGFLSKNTIASSDVEAIPLLLQMLMDNNERIILQDADGTYRFNAELVNVDALQDQLKIISSIYGDAVEAAREPVLALYEKVFNHRSFTGRSGGMFGFEGLGCIYWHMVSKLLLAVQENYFAALEQGASALTCQRLGKLYYRVRSGIGFNKTPVEYGAFPTDPYSHTPKHAGAQQPGMTGQVKEEVLTRFGELGVRVSNGRVLFQPSLLRTVEFAPDEREFRYLDVNGAWQTLTVPAGGLAFTWCQVPVIYRLVDEQDQDGLTITRGDVEQHVSELALNVDDSSEVFRRSGSIRRLNVALKRSLLFQG